MKRLFLVVNVIIIALIMLSCKSTDGSSHDQVVKASIELASEYCADEKYEKALEVYEHACGIAEDYRLEYNRAYVLSCLGKNDLAAEVCREAYEYYPEYFMFQTARSEYLYLAGKYEEEILLDAEILDHDPYAHDIRQRLMKLFYDHNETSRAYDQAVILWDQGYRNKEIAEILHGCYPDQWDKVYEYYIPPEKTTETDLQENIVNEYFVQEAPQNIIEIRG